LVNIFGIFGSATVLAAFSKILANFIQFLSHWSKEKYIQGTLTEEECSIRLTSLYFLGLDQLLLMTLISFTFLYKTSYLNEEVNCTELSPSVSVPCNILVFLCCRSRLDTETIIAQSTTTTTTTTHWHESLQTRR
jgi:hypothetical protein